MQGHIKMRRFLLSVSAIVGVTFAMFGGPSLRTALAQKARPLTTIPPKATKGLCNELEDRWNFDALAETASGFEKLLADAVRTGDKACELEAMTQLARVKGLEKDFRSAEEILTVVSTRLEPAMVAPRMRLMLERGRVLLDTHREKEAASAFEKAWTLGRAGGDEYLTVDAADPNEPRSGPEASTTT